MARDKVYISATDEQAEAALVLVGQLWQDGKLPVSRLMYAPLAPVDAQEYALELMPGCEAFIQLGDQVDLETQKRDELDLPTFASFLDYQNNTPV